MAKIAIDAGHGRYTPGKRCLKSLDKNQTREWVLNDRVADSLEEYLKSAGHTTMRVDDVTGKTDVSLARRVSKANKWKADVYISVHQNAGINGGSGGGTVVFTCVNCGTKSAELQNAVYKHAIKRGKLKGNRYDGTPSSNFYVITFTNMPAILVECGFMDSSTDIDYILDPKWSKKIALGIAEGVCDVYGGNIGEVDVAKKEAKKKTTTAYYKKYTGKSTQVDTVLKAIGVPSKCYGSYSKRKPIAKNCGISLYIGSASQNLKIVDYAKKGKIKKV